MIHASLILLIVIMSLNVSLLAKLKMMVCEIRKNIGSSQCSIYVEIQIFK